MTNLVVRNISLSDVPNRRVNQETDEFVEVTSDSIEEAYKSKYVPKPAQSSFLDSIESMSSLTRSL